MGFVSDAGVCLIFFFDFPSLGFSSVLCLVIVLVSDLGRKE